MEYIGYIYEERTIYGRKKISKNLFSSNIPIESFLYSFCILFVLLLG